MCGDPCGTFPQAVVNGRMKKLPSLHRAKTPARTGALKYFRGTTLVYCTLAGTASTLRQPYAAYSRTL